MEEGNQNKQKYHYILQSEEINNIEFELFVANLLFFFFQIIRMAYATFFPGIKVIVACVGILCLIYTLFFARVKIEKMIALPFIVYLCAIVSAIYTNNYRIEELIMPAMYIGPTLMLLFFDIKYEYSKAFFMAISAFYALALMGLMGSGIFAHFSQNYVSVDMLNACSILYICAYKQKKKYSLSPVISVAVLCLWSKGRAAIIIGSLLSIFSIVYYMWIRNKFEKKSNVIIVVTLLCVIMISYYFLFDSYIMPYLDKFYNANDGGLTSRGREMLLNEYLAQIEYIPNFIFGVPCKKNQMFLLFGANWHNSYLRLHCFFGLAGFLTVVGNSIHALYVFWCKNKMFFIILLIILVRITSDSAAFNGVLDSVLYYFMALAWMMNPDTRIQQEIREKQNEETIWNQ